jgi:hypothetical protein
MRVSLIRRVNLGNYQHWELFVEADSLEEVIRIMNRGLQALGQPQISVEKA